MKDARGAVIYVGKALSLKKRLSSYFTAAASGSVKTGILVRKIHHFETIATASEKEALLLEATLIKRHRPRYNVMLKDDKRYPSLCLDTSHPYPNLTIVRKTERRDVRYFGPFASAQAVRQTLRFINKTFKLRKCKNREFGNRERPCLHYQMNACLGPCCLPVDKDLYQRLVKEVVLLLKGRTPQLVTQLRKKMRNAAAEQRFEDAADYRDKIFALQKTLQKQAAVSTDAKDRDVVGVAEEAELTIVTLLGVRGGLLVGSRHYAFSNVVIPDTELLETFVRQYYQRTPFIAPEIILPRQLEAASMLELWLSEGAGRRVRLIHPQRGHKRTLLEMARRNARDELRGRLSKQATLNTSLAQLQRSLRLNQLPRRIECFDNSNLSGSNPVAGMVVFVNGEPFKNDYRRFHLETTIGSDDYNAMAEALRRRFQSDTAPPQLPDLLLIDGGKGQLNVARHVLGRLNLTDKMIVVGLAKKDADRGDVDDKVYLPGRANPVPMLRYHQGLLMLQRIRDEAHRFAVQTQRRRRTQKAHESALDSIPGIGPRRKRALLTHFGDIDRIRRASREELAALPGMNRTAAAAIQKHL
jgi:excinuclease ABC subunit C